MDVRVIKIFIRQTLMPLQKVAFVSLMHMLLLLFVLRLVLDVAHDAGGAFAERFASPRVVAVRLVLRTQQPLIPRTKRAVRCEV